MALQMEFYKPFTGYETGQVYHKDDSPSMDVMNTSSHQLCSMLDNSIRDVREKKKKIVTTMELVNRLMGEVEKEEKAAEDAKEETAWSSLDILAKVEECKQALLQAQEANNMLVEKLNAEKDVLTTKFEVLRGRVTNILDDEDRSLDILNKMCTSLELRLKSALTEKEMAFRNKEENEYVLAYHENQIEMAVEEYHRLKEETTENSKLQKILDDRHQSIEMLQEEISDKFKDVNLIKEGVDPSVLTFKLLTFDSTRSSLEENKNVVEAITEEPQAMLSEGSVDSKSTIKSNDCGENHKSIVESENSADTDNREAGANDIQLINGDMSDILEEVEPLLTKNLVSSSLEKPKEDKDVAAAAMTEEPKALLMESPVTVKSAIQSKKSGKKPKSEAKLNGLKVDSNEEKLKDIFDCIMAFMIVMFGWFIYRLLFK